MRGATAGRTIHLNQSTTIHKESATLFIPVRGVAFITVMFSIVLLLTIIPSSAQFVNGNFSLYLQNWTATGSASTITSSTYCDGVNIIAPAANLYAEDDIDDGLTKSSISQVVTFPRDALLTFKARSSSSTGGSGSLPYIKLNFYVDGVYLGQIYSKNSALSSVYTVSYNLSAYSSGSHTVKFETTISRDGATWGSGNIYMDNIVLSGDYSPELPQSSGIISFQNDPYDLVDTVQLHLEEDVIDWQSYNCVGDTCSWQPAYYWNLLEPLYYYQDVPIVRVWEGEFYNDTWYTLDYNPFMESIVGLTENPYSHVLNYQYTNQKNISSTDGAFLRADFVVRRDWYAWVSLSGWRKLIGSHETIIDSDYAYHTPLSNVNYTTDNPAVSPDYPSQDDTPFPTDMIPDNSTSLPDGTDLDNDGIDDNEDTDDDGNGEDDSNDNDDDGIPDPIDADDSNPDITSPEDPGYNPPQDSDGDGVDDSVDTDDDNDQIPDDQDPDDDNDGIPDPIDGGNLNSTIPDPYQNSTYEGYLPANNSTFTYSVLEGYYSTVDGVFAPIDSGVTGVIGFVTSPVYSLSSSINSVNGYAVSVFSSSAVAIQPASLIMGAVFDSMPDKVKGIVSYYILLTLILIILGRSW